MEPSIVLKVPQSQASDLVATVPITNSVANINKDKNFIESLEKMKTEKMKRKIEKN
jgi:hypothetical protein